MEKVKVEAHIKTANAKDNIEELKKRLEWKGFEGEIEPGLGVITLKGVAGKGFAQSLIAVFPRSAVAIEEIKDRWQHDWEIWINIYERFFSNSLLDEGFAEAHHRLEILRAQAGWDEGSSEIEKRLLKEAGEVVAELK